MEQLTLNLLINNNINEVLEHLKELLSDVAKELRYNNEDYYFILQDDSVFSLIKDTNSNEKINEIYNVFKDVNNNKIKEPLLLLLNKIKNVYLISYEENEIQQRNTYLYNTVFMLLEKCNGILYNNGAMFDCKSNLILNLDGKTELDEYKPVLSIKDTYKKREDITKEDKEKYLNSIKIIKENDLPYLENMELALRKSDIELRSIKEIALRAITLFGVAAYSELIVHEDFGIEGAIEELDYLENKFNINNNLTKKEKDYINSKSSSRSSVFTWRYESCALLLWVLGFIEIENNSDLCDVEEMYHLIHSFENIDEFIKRVNLRSIDELLNKQDLIMRYRWACIEVKRRIPHLDSSVLYERHYALNWLLTKLFGNEWDEIETPA